MAFCFFPISLMKKKLKPRDSKTHVVTQGLVFRRALCLVSYSVATFLKVLGYESRGSVFSLCTAGLQSDEDILECLPCSTHTGR